MTRKPTLKQIEAQFDKEVELYYQVDHREDYEMKELGCRYQELDTYGSPKLQKLRAQHHKVIDRIRAYKALFTPEQWDSQLKDQYIDTWGSHND